MTMLSEYLITSGSVNRTTNMSALQDLSSGLGAATGIALLGTLGAILYRATLAIPTSLAPPDAAAAVENPGAAVAIAHSLPGDSRASFLASVATAMGTGAWAALLTAAILIGIAIVVIRIGMPRRSPTSTRHRPGGA